MWPRGQQRADCDDEDDDCDDCDDCDDDYDDDGNGKIERYIGEFCSLLVNVGVNTNVTQMLTRMYGWC